MLPPPCQAVVLPYSRQASMFFTIIFPPKLCFIKEDGVELDKVQSFKEYLSQLRNFLVKHEVVALL